jgi:hypothetical protein
LARAALVELQRLLTAAQAVLHPLLPELKLFLQLAQRVALVAFPRVSQALLVDLVLVAF